MILGEATIVAKVGFLWWYQVKRPINTIDKNTASAIEMTTEILILLKVRFLSNNLKGGRFLWSTSCSSKKSTIKVVGKKIQFTQKLRVCQKPHIWFEYVLH